jgi:hypothetical protein
VLAAVADRDGEACKGRASLGAAKPGIVGDISDWSYLVHHYLSFLGAIWLRPKPFRRIRSKGRGRAVVNGRRRRSEHPWTRRVRR